MGKKKLYLGMLSLFRLIEHPFYRFVHKTLGAHELDREGLPVRSVDSLVDDEVQMRSLGIASLAGVADKLTPLYLLSHLHNDTVLLEVIIGGQRPVTVLDDDMVGIFFISLACSASVRV